MGTSCPRMCRSTVTWIVAGVFIVIPPILLTGGAVVWSALNYTGDCPTALTHALPSCTMVQYLQTLIFNPASMGVHLFVVARWIVLTSILIGVLGAAECYQCYVRPLHRNSSSSNDPARL